MRWRVPTTASKEELRRAVQQWADSPDCDEKTMPGDVAHVSEEELAVWLRTGSCGREDL